MKKLLIAIALLSSLSSIAGVSINTPSKTINFVDGKGSPLEGVVLEYSATYNECYKWYFGTGNPCSQEYITEGFLDSNADGDVLVPAIKKSIKNGFNQENEDIDYTISVFSFTDQDLEDNYSDCGYSLKSHIKTIPLSQNLIDYQEENGFGSSCFYNVEDESRISSTINGDIECKVTGTRDLGFVNGRRTHIEVSLKEAIKDYKELCDRR